jgi:hypothetical protein
MKKLLMFLSFALFIAGSSMAGQAELFAYNQDALEVEMADLTSLEKFVVENPGVSLSDLIASENKLVSGIANTNAFFGMESMNERVLGIGGFWWGCCLGPVGILVVWLAADDPGETRSSIIGCIINVLLSGGGSFLYQSGSLNF